MCFDFCKEEYDLHADDKALPHPMLKNALIKIFFSLHAPASHIYALVKQRGQNLN